MEWVKWPFISLYYNVVIRLSVMRAEFSRLQGVFIPWCDPPAWAGKFKVPGDGRGVGDFFLQISTEEKNRDYHCSSYK